jgi:hypothetical protein
MKTLVIGTLYAVMTTAATIPMTQAQTIPGTATPQIVMADADPLETQATESGSATHFIDIKVEGNPISQLTIGFPTGLRIAQGIKVTARSKQSVNATVSMNGNSSTINFAQPVQPGTTLKIALRGVTAQSNVNDLWLYPISVRYINETENIPIGTARIQTYDQE